MAFVDVYFSLGSNLGDREANISRALREMDKAFGVHYSVLSSVIETEPMGFSGEDFLNVAALYRLCPSPAKEVPEGMTSMTHVEAHALEVLRSVKSVERAMGRTDPPEYDTAGNRVYHSRIIDIDILFYGSERIDLPELTIPHKGISDRPFVMIPLLEIAKPSLRRAFPEYFLEDSAKFKQEGCP